MLCRCDCGNLKEVDINKLHSGHTKSCGCLNHKKMDLVGKRFGRLTVLEFAYNEDKKNYWKCRCDCGNICYVCTAWLTNGTTVSCGCKNKENIANFDNIDKGFVDGTNIHAIKETRKVNKNNTSGYKGVTYNKERKKWIAQITFKHKNHNLGRFDRKEEAIEARKEGEEFYFGKYRKNRK